MDKKERRHLGAHYTSEVNIMKLVRSLFLDDLHDDLKGWTHIHSVVPTALHHDLNLFRPLWEGDWSMPLIKDSIREHFRGIKAIRWL